MGNHLVANPSFYFFIARTEVNVYLAIKYFLDMDDNFINSRRNMANALINNSYMNEKACGSPEKTITRKISHILETMPTFATNYDKKMGLHHKI